MSSVTTVQSKKKKTKCTLKFLPQGPYLLRPYEKKLPILKILPDLISNRGEGDVTILIGDKSFKCHSTVLTIHSRLIAPEAYKARILKLPQFNVTYDAFEVAYNWMTLLKCECPQNEVVNLLRAARYLKVDNLGDAVINCLSDQRNFFGLDAFECMLEALNKDIRSLVDVMIERVGIAFIPLISTLEFRQLDVQQAAAILKSKNLGVQSETEVFYAALVWLLHDLDNRIAAFHQVLDAVNFEFLSSKFLLCTALNIPELSEDIAKLLYPKIQVAMYNQQSLHILGPRTEYHRYTRIFIKDEECPYLKHLDDNDWMISFALFIKYLKKVRKNFKNFFNRVTDRYAAIDPCPVFELYRSE